MIYYAMHLVGFVLLDDMFRRIRHKAALESQLNEVSTCQDHRQRPPLSLPGTILLNAGVCVLQLVLLYLVSSVNAIMFFSGSVTSVAPPAVCQLNLEMHHAIHVGCLGFTELHVCLLWLPMARTAS